MTKLYLDIGTDMTKKEELSINGLTNEVDIITGVIENIEDGNIDSAIDDLYQLRSYKEASWDKNNQNPESSLKLSIILTNHLRKKNLKSFQKMKV